MKQIFLNVSFNHYLNHKPFDNTTKTVAKGVIKCVQIQITVSSHYRNRVKTPNLTIISHICKKSFDVRSIFYRFRHFFFQKKKLIFYTNEKKQKTFFKIFIIFNRVLFKGKFRRVIFFKFVFLKKFVKNLEFV